METARKKKLHKKPLFIAIDGGEGAGKSTVISALTKHLKKQTGLSVVQTREPGGTPYAEAIRDLALKHDEAKSTNPTTMLLLMFAARFELVHRLILKALKSGKHVVCDRFDISTFAYQLYGQGARHLEEIFWNLRDELPRLPDVYIYLDVDVKTGLKRVQKRAEAGGEVNHFDRQAISFHTRLRKGYRSFLNDILVQSKVIIIDANQTKEEVVEDLISELNEII